jgi:ABC-type branched-subunit amino acid transport system substrate-binding protein
MPVSEINAAGGLLGETVETVVADDYCDPQQAVAAANKLVGRPGTWHRALRWLGMLCRLSE